MKAVVGEAYPRESSHACLFPLERGHARWCLHAFGKGMNGPTASVSGSWETPTSVAFATLSANRGVEGFS
jgi:hypothetical protein